MDKNPEGNDMPYVVAAAILTVGVLVLVWLFRLRG